MSIYPKQLNKRHNIPGIALKALCAFGAIIIVIIMIISLLPTASSHTADITDLDSLYRLGQKQMTSHDYKEAIKTMTTVGQYASSKNNTADSVLAVKAYNNAGVINFFNKNYAAAYSFYKHALDAGGTRHGYYVGTNLAYIYRMYNDIETAKKLLKTAYRHSKETNDTSHLLPAYYNYLYFAMMDNFKDSVGEMITDFRSLDFPRNGTIDHLNVMSDGIASYIDGRYSDAVGQFKKAESVASATRFPQRSKIDCELYIAQSFMAADQPDSALHYFKNAALLCDDETSTDYLPDIYWRIHDCYDKLGRKDLALQTKVEYYNLRDSLFSFQDLTTIKNLDSDYRGREYEKQIAVVIAEKNRQTIRWVTAMIFLVITETLLVITYVQKRKLKESNITLFNKNIQLLESIEQAKEDYLSNREAVPRSSEEGNEHTDENETLLTDSDPLSQEQNSNPAASINISEEEQNRIKEEIKNFFYTSKEYLSTDFSLKRLCEIVKSNRFYVSYVINNVLHTTFHALVNEYRINEAKIRLLDNAKYGHLTIESIAEGVGYKSRSNFARNFKANTGLTPSEFIAIAKAEHNS